LVEKESLTNTYEPVPVQRGTGFSGKAAKKLAPATIAGEIATRRFSVCFVREYQAKVRALVCFALLKVCVREGLGPEDAGHHVPGCKSACRGQWHK
jgi:hypothetical protein